MKERLWPMGIAAFITHGLMIAALALGISYPQGVSSQDFRVEVMFMSEPGQEKGTSEAPREFREEPPINKVTKIFQAKKSSMHSGKKMAAKTTSFKLLSSPAGHPSGEADATFPIFNPPPIYPYEAKRKRLQGIVLVQLSLTETGTVHKATTLPPRMDPLLEDAALSAIYKWRFKPGPRTLEVPIEFKLVT